jgi:hypothetical protein
LTGRQRDGERKWLTKHEAAHPTDSRIACVFTLLERFRRASPANAFEKIDDFEATAGVYRPLTLIGKDCIQGPRATPDKAYYFVSLWLIAGV